MPSIQTPSTDRCPRAESPVRAGVTAVRAAAPLLVTLTAGLAWAGPDLRHLPALASAATGNARSEFAADQLVAWLNADPGGALAAGAAGLGWLVLGWLGLGSVVHAVAMTPGFGSSARRRVLAPVSRRMLPALLRHGLDVALRGAVVVGLTSSGAAATSAWVVADVGTPAAAASTPGPALGWPDLDRPTGPPPTAPATLVSPDETPAPPVPPVILASPASTESNHSLRGPGTGPAGDRLRVSPGDTLWAIAAAELGPQATDRDIAARWPDWYAANTGVVGPDPNLILPGQWLVQPGPAPSARGGRS